MEVKSEHTIPALLNQFESVSLEGLNQVELMDRVDQKFIIHRNNLSSLLTDISQDYRVLEHQGIRMFRYSSQYFDTSARKYYIDHHNGKPNRTKVRTRTYLDSGDFFFEVKRKIKGRRTDKQRIAITEHTLLEDDAVSEFLEHCHIDGTDLEPTLLVNYSRITLMGKDLHERITIDLGLEFSIGDKRENTGEMVIVEVKQDRIKRESPVIVALRKRMVRPAGISKYVMGLVMLQAIKKTNAFRHKIARINQLIAQYGNYGYNG